MVTEIEFSIITLADTWQVMTHKIYDKLRVLLPQSIKQNQQNSTTAIGFGDPNL